MRIENETYFVASNLSGRLNGNGMAFADRSSNEIMNSLYGVVVKNSSLKNSRNIKF